MPRPPVIPRLSPWRFGGAVCGGRPSQSHGTFLGRLRRAVDEENVLLQLEIRHMDTADSRPLQRGPTPLALTLAGLCPLSTQGYSEGWIAPALSYGRWCYFLGEHLPLERVI